MKKNYSTSLFNRSKTGRFYFLAAISLLFGSAGLNGQNSYTFVTGGATGSVAPTLGQLNSVYSGNNLNGMVTVSGGIQSWTVPATGMYQIEAYGAQGGNTPNDANLGGLGAKIKGEFSFNAGTVLEIVVGQRGANSSVSGCGGGAGGSGVRQNGTVIIVAGGGGGAGLGGNNGMAASITTSGTATSSGLIQGGNSGNGGNASANNGGGCGGGGLLTAGAKPAGGTPNQAGPGGFAAAGGAQSIWCGGTAGSGGFGVGGGGGGEGQNGGGGGGGGYSGGAGGEWSNSGWCSIGPAYGGGGGGSYNTGANPVNTASVNSGEGKVIITSMCDVQLNGSTAICLGGSTTLSTTAVSNILWSNGSTGSAVILSPQSTTQYTVSGNGTINNCTSTIIFSVVVNPLPSITTNVTPQLLCIGSTATVTASGAATYTWITGPSTATTFANPVVSTSYNVSGTSSVGCVSSVAYNVVVDALQLSISGNTAICMGKSTTLTGGDGTSLAWVDFGPFANISPSPTVATVYTLTGIDPNNCPQSATVTVLVNQNPTVTASASKTLICKGQAVTLTAGGASTYSWGASAGSAVTPTVSVSPAINTTFNYSVTGTDANGCTGTSNVAVRVELCTGINELQNSGIEISVYPNPNNGQFIVKTNEAATLKITNELGQLVRTLVVPASNEISVSGLSKGIYFISIEGDGTKANKKMIVD